MKKRIFLGLLMVVVFAFPALPETLRVMSFNVRLPSPGDGENIWEKRRDILVETIRLKNPDIMGTQELHKAQGDYIVGKLPEYRWFGISRRGTEQDEYMGIFYKHEALRVVESGNFFLSDTPEKPGSMTWGNIYPRMVTWALFEIKQSGVRFYHYNTHFPHRSQDTEARLKCANLVYSRMSQLPSEMPVVLTGDFNTDAGGEVYKVFAGYKDAWLEASKRSGPQTTKSNWTGNTEGSRIDWILYRGP